jgi:hypothetical protein
MESIFIKRVIKDLLKKYKDPKSLILILPSEQTAGIAKKEFAAKEIFFDEIYTMKKWMEKLSKLSLIEKFPFYIDFFEILKKKNFFQINNLKNF